MRIVLNGHEVPAWAGDTILSALRRAERNIHSICGGRGMCGTCRVAVAEDWFDSLPAPAFAEVRLLRVLKAALPHHRLACQTVLTDAHDGLRFSPDTPPTKMLQQETI